MRLNLSIYFAMNTFGSANFAHPDGAFDNIKSAKGLRMPVMSIDTNRKSGKCSVFFVAARRRRRGRVIAQAAGSSTSLSQNRSIDFTVAMNSSKLSGLRM